MTKLTYPLVIVLLLLLCLPATAREVSIGTHGATLTLDESWQRQTLNPNVGPDQFRHEDSIFAIVVESQALLERRADFELQLETFLSDILARFQESELDPLIEYRRTGRVGHCTRRLLANLPSVQLAYQFDLVSRDGLGYLLMTWSAASDAAKLHEVASQVADRITFPDAESEWGKTAEPTPHSFRFDEWKVELSYRESVFPTRVDEEQYYSLTSTEGTVAIHLFLDRYDDIDPESALDDIVGVVREGSTLEELERIDVELQAGKGRQALLRAQGEQGSYDVAIAMVEVADNTYVDVRLVSVGEAGHRERLWNTLLESLKVTPPEQVDAFPVVDVSPADEVVPLNRAARELLTHATRIETGGAFVQSAVPAADGSIVVLDSKRLLKVGKDAEPEVLYRSEEWLGGRRLAVARDEILLMTSAQQVSAIVDRQLQPAGFEAAYAAAAGTGLVLVRAGQTPRMLGFERLVNPEPSRLIERSAAGEERTVVELGDLEVDAMAVGADGSTVLLAGKDRHLLENEGFNTSDRNARLLEIHLGTAAQRRLGTWNEIRNLAAADTGWLVSGAPRDGLMGLYLLGPDGERELLISGDVSGVALRDGKLTFTAGVCLPPLSEGEEGGTCLYQAAMELVREHGPGSWPLTADTFNRIAEQLLRDGNHRFTTRAELSDLVKAADTVCEELTSQPLPSSSAAVDQLFEDLVGGASLTDDAVELLAAVMTEALLREGAEWVGSSAPTASRATGLGQMATNHFAIAFQPIQVVISTLYDDEGWWDPVSTLLDQADGRALLLGHDRQALISEVGRRDQPAVEDLLKQDDPSGILRLLEEHRRNVHLRKRVYRHFAAAGRSEDLARLAQGFATIEKTTAEKPDAEDLRAWLAARLSLAPEGQDLDRLIGDLKAAIAGHPDQAAFYLLLGSAYERTSYTDRLALARACYKKAVELISWGEINDAAEQAIERIEQEGKE